MTAGYQTHPHSQSPPFPWISEQALPLVYVSPANSLLNPGRAALTDWYVCSRRKEGENVIIVRLMQREMGRGVFIVEHRFDGCPLYVVKMGKVTLDSRCMTLNNRPFKVGRGGNWRIPNLQTLVFQRHTLKTGLNRTLCLLYCGPFPY